MECIERADQLHARLWIFHGDEPTAASIMKIRSVAFGRPALLSFARSTRLAVEQCFLLHAAPPNEAARI